MAITFLDIFIIIIILVLVILFIKKNYGEVEYIKSSIDNKTYLVKKLPDSQQAADILAGINKKIERFIKHMLSKYASDSEAKSDSDAKNDSDASSNASNAADVKRLYENYNPENISEGTSEHGYTSYTINKGERIIVCIREKDTLKFSDENAVMYVVIHELTHMAITEIGHTPLFWEKFKWFLEEAVQIGIYKKVDYSKKPVNYCGIQLTTSVLV
jgi:hypothetical protein